jgi:hypothetical protein
MAMALQTTTTTMAGSLGCTRDVSLLPAAANGDGGPGDGGPPSADATSVFCQGLGTPIQFPTASGMVCASSLAARGHRFALCSCASLEPPTAAPIHTDSFDSRPGSVAIGRSAAIGVGDLVSSSAEIWSGGALYAVTALASTGHIETAGSLRTGGPIVLINADGHVAGDAYVNGSISGTLQIDGLLHQPAGAGMSPALLPESSIVREAVSVPPPCDCSSSFVDLTGAIAASVARNDDAIVGLDPNALAAEAAAINVDVTCGVYVLSAIDAQKSLSFSVHGRALVVVTGDVVIRGGLTVVLDPSAELDLLVGGRLVSSGGNPIGSASPARFRVWIAGTASVVLDDAPTVGAIIHAPNAAVSASSGLQISGALLAGSVMLGGQLNVHFDEAVLSSGGPCGEPAATPVP